MICFFYIIVDFIQKYGNFTKFIFYRRNGSSGKYTEAISGQVAQSRQTLEVATRNSVMQQF